MARIKARKYEIKSPKVDSPLLSERIMKLISEGRVKVWGSLKEFYDRKKKAKTF